MSIFRQRPNDLPRRRPTVPLLFPPTGSTISFDFAISSTSSTPDTGELTVANQVLVAPAVASTSSTPDTGILNVARPTSFAVASTSSTPDSGAIIAGNYCLRFHGNNEGTGTNTDRVHIELDNPSDPPIDVGAGDFCYEFWIRCRYADNASTATGTDARESNILLDRDIWGDSRGWVFGLTRDTGVLVCCFGVAGGGGWTTIFGAISVGDAVWHHVAFTRNSSNQVRIWVDGVQDVQGTYSGDLSFPNGGGGSSPNGSDPYLNIGTEKHDADPDVYLSYNGHFDEFRVSNAVRYTTNFTRPSAPFTVDGSTVALFHIDEGSGTAMSDSSGLSGAENGLLLVGGSPSGPEWVTSTLFQTIGIAPAISSTSSTPDTGALLKKVDISFAVASTSSTPDTAILNVDRPTSFAVASTSSTPDTGILNALRALTMAISSLSTTPDTGAILRLIEIAEAVASTSSTPDTGIVNILRSIAEAVASLSSTGDTGNLSVTRPTSLQIDSLSSTPDTGKANVLREIAPAVGSLSSTPDTGALTVVGQVDLAFAISSLSSTPNNAELTVQGVIDIAFGIPSTSITGDGEITVARQISFEIASTSSTPNDADLDLDKLLSFGIASQSSTPDATLSVLRQIAPNTASQSTTPSVTMLRIIQVTFAVVSQSLTPDTGGLATSELQGVATITAYSLVIKVKAYVLPD